MTTCSSSTCYILDDLSQIRLVVVIISREVEGATGHRGLLLDWHNHARRDCVHAETSSVAWSLESRTFLEGTVDATSFAHCWQVPRMLLGLELLRSADCRDVKVVVVPSEFDCMSTTSCILKM